jgi:Flp pilus assembly secretin CpaC
MALVVCAAALAARIPAATAQAEKVSITLRVGEQRVIPSHGVNSYSEGTRGIVDVRLTPDASSFVVVGQRAGHTSLLFLLDDGHERSFEIDVLDGSQGAAVAPAGVAPRANIRLDFYFVQVSSDYRHQLGVSWPGAIGGGAVSASYDLVDGRMSDASALISDQALPQLDVAQSHGWAKVLRQAAFVTANGSSAKLSGGGELNVPVQGALGGALKQITFGTEIEVLPRYDRESGRIELTLHADVSDLTSDGGTGVPGRTVSTLDSIVNLELGESVVLAGLRAKTERATRNGLPGLSAIPILGALFGSDGRSRGESETLVFIVPSVVDTVSLHARAAIAEAMRDFAAFDGDFNATPLAKHVLPAGPGAEASHD